MRFIDSLRLLRHVAAPGGPRSTVVGPDDACRLLLSAGLEHENDILADLVGAVSRLAEGAGHIS